MTNEAPHPARSPRLRLLVVTQHFWPENFRINGFVEALQAAGAEVAVLTGQPNYPEGRTFPGFHWWKAGVSVHPKGFAVARTPLLPRGDAGHIRLFANYVSFVVSAGLIGPLLLRGRRFDAILVYGTSPIFQAFAAWPLRWITRAPIALWVQDLWPSVLVGTGYIRSGPLLALVERAVSWVYRGSDLLLGQSRAFVEAIRPLAGTTPVEYLPNPGESAQSPASDTSAADLGAGFNIVFAGNLGRAQALEDVVRCADLLRDRVDITIWLFGSGALQDRLAAMIAEKGLTNVRLPGRISPDEVSAVLTRADAALLTLVDDPMVAKTVPSKLQTYLAAAIPVVVGAGGEAARITHEAGAGIVAPPCEPDALAKAIAEMADLPHSERMAMGERAGRYYSEHFRPERLASDLVERLVRLATDNSKGTRT